MNALPQPDRSAPERPLDVEALLYIVSAAVWNADRNLKLIDKGSPQWHHWYGRHCALIVVLQRLRAFPVGSFERAQSTEELCRSLSAFREKLPAGFEFLPPTEANRLFVAHGIKATLAEVPLLQRHLVAGLNYPAPRRDPDAASTQAGKSSACLLGLSKDAFNALQRAANCLDVNIEGLTAAKVAQLYRALGCQIIDDFAARLTREWGNSHSCEGDVAVRQLDRQHLPIRGDKNDGADIHGSNLGGDQ